MIATNCRGVHARLLVEAQRLDPRRQDEAVEARTGFARRANHYVVDQQRADVGAFGVDRECPHHGFGGLYRSHFYDHAIQNAAVATEGDEIEAGNSGDAAVTVETILRQQGTDVATIEPDASIRRAADWLRIKNIGALVVTSGKAVLGLI